MNAHKYRLSIRVYGYRRLRNHFLNSNNHFLGWKRALLAGGAPTLPIGLLPPNMGFPEVFIWPNWLGADWLGWPQRGLDCGCCAEFWKLFWLPPIPPIAQPCGWDWVCWLAHPLWPCCPLWSQLLCGWVCELFWELVKKFPPEEEAKLEKDLVAFPPPKFIALGLKLGLGGAVVVLNLLFPVPKATLPWES